MHYNLLDLLEEIEDPRRAQGQRHPLVSLLSIIIMAIISGEQGLRGFARFAKYNEEELVAAFDLKHGTPSFGTFRSLLLGLDCNKLAEAFQSWMKKNLPNQAEKWIALDGKSLGSTLTNPNTALQNFVMVVTAFAHHSGLVLAMESFDNGKSGEGQAARHLIKSLGLKGAIFTLDAGHAQKKL